MQEQGSTQTQCESMPTWARRYDTAALATRDGWLLSGWAGQCCHTQYMAHSNTVTDCVVPKDRAYNLNVLIGQSTVSRISEWTNPSIPTAESKAKGVHTQCGLQPTCAASPYRGPATRRHGDRQWPAARAGLTCTRYGAVACPQVYVPRSTCISRQRLRGLQILALALCPMR